VGDDAAGFWQEIRKPGAFTHECIEALRPLVEREKSLTSPTHVYVAERVGLETLDAMIRLDASIRKLDESSGELVSTTNRLTTRIFWLTVATTALTFVGVVLAAIQIWFTPRG
jgi:hypothetical protein